MKQLYTAIAIALLAATPLRAQNVQKLTASKANDYGIAYSLPLTRINVTLEARHTTLTPGPFALYARKYLGLDPILEPSDTWQITNAMIWTDGVSDDSQRYMVQFRSGSTPSMMLSAETFPLTLNYETPRLAHTPLLPAAVSAEPTILQRPVAKQVMTQEMLQATSTAKRAELAAARIYELRQNRNDIISGQADGMPSDGQAMNLALQSLADQEAALTAMFTGTRQESTQVRTYTYVPRERCGDLSVVIARLSQISGLVAADNLSGAPVTLSLHVTQQASTPLTDKGEEKKLPKGGLAYRIPGQATVTVSVDNRTLASADINLAQEGLVFAVETSLFTDKKAPAYAIFDPTTGAIVELGTATE